MASPRDAGDFKAVHHTPDDDEHVNAGESAPLAIEHKSIAETSVASVVEGNPFPYNPWVTPIAVGDGWLATLELKTIPRFLRCGENRQVLHLCNIEKKGEKEEEIILPKLSKPEHSYYVRALPNNRCAVLGESNLVIVDLKTRKKSEKNVAYLNEFVRFGRPIFFNDRYLARSVQERDFLGNHVANVIQFVDCEGDKHVRHEIKEPIDFAPADLSVIPPNQIILGNKVFQVILNFDGSIAGCCTPAVSRDNRKGSFLKMSPDATFAILTAQDKKIFQQKNSSPYELTALPKDLPSLSYSCNFLPDNRLVTTNIRTVFMIDPRHHQESKLFEAEEKSSIVTLCVTPESQAIAFQNSVTQNNTSPAYMKSLIFSFSYNLNFEPDPKCNNAIVEALPSFSEAVCRLIAAYTTNTPSLLFSVRRNQGYQPPYRLCEEAKNIMKIGMNNLDAAIRAREECLRKEEIDEKSAQSFKKEKFYYEIQKQAIEKFAENIRNNRKLSVKECVDQLKKDNSFNEAINASTPDFALPFVQAKIILERILKAEEKASLQLQRRPK